MNWKHKTLTAIRCYLECLSVSLTFNPGAWSIQACTYSCAQTHTHTNTRAWSNSSTFWDMCVFASLPRVKWEDWHHLHVCQSCILLEKSSQLAENSFPSNTCLYSLTCNPEGNNSNFIYNRQKWKWHWSSHLTLSKKSAYFPNVQPLKYTDGPPGAARKPSVCQGTGCNAYDALQEA